MKTPAKSLGKGSSALCAMLLKSIDDKDPTVRDAAVLVVDVHVDTAN